MIQQIFISLPMFVCGLLSVELAVSLWLKYDRAQTCLQMWSLTATVLYAMHYIFFTHPDASLPVADAIYITCNLAVYPLYLIYIYELTDDRPLRYSRMAMAALLLASALCGVIDWLFYGTPQEELVHNVCRVLFALGCVGTVFFGIRRIRSYHRLLDSLYADPEERKLNSISTILYILLVTALASIVANFLGRDSFIGTRLVAVPSLVFSCLLFAIGQVGLRLKYSIRDIEADEAKEEPEAQSIAEKPKDVALEEQTRETSVLVVKLRTLVEDERLFTEPNLKLDDVARRLGTNRTYLLRAMKQDLQLSFSEYINKQRIAYAVQLMKSHPDWTKEDIAAQVGYASLSSFYRNLKEFSS